jgi:hypothetical protein
MMLLWLSVASKKDGRTELEVVAAAVLSDVVAEDD